MDQNKVTEFLGRFVSDLGATGAAGSVVTGHRLGLYRALAQGPGHPRFVHFDRTAGGSMPTTATQLVARAESRVENLTPDQVAEETTRDAVLVDLREPAVAQPVDA